MTESEETKWRLGVEPEEAEKRAAELSSEEDEKKEGLQQTIQAKADEIGGGEGSIVADTPKKKERKAKALTVKKSEPDTSKDMTKQIERHANQLTRMEKGITSLQKSINKIDKQSNTIKQIYVVVTQIQKLQKQMHNILYNQNKVKFVQYIIIKSIQLIYPSDLVVKCDVRCSETKYTAKILSEQDITNDDYDDDPSRF